MKLLVTMSNIVLGVIKSIGDLHGTTHCRKSTISSDDCIKLRLEVGSWKLEMNFCLIKIDRSNSLLKVKFNSKRFSFVHQHNVQITAGDGVDELSFFSVRLKSQLSLSVVHHPAMHGN